MTTHELRLEIPAEWWHTANDRGSWRKFAPKVKHLRSTAAWHARAARLPRIELAHVMAFIGYPTRVVADPGNASPVVKAILDGLTDAGVWDDDDSKHVIGPDYRREAGTTGRKGLHTVRLVLTEQEVQF